jgi:hypothetical protein
MAIPGRPPYLSCAVIAVIETADLSGPMEGSCRANCLKTVNRMTGTIITTLTDAIIRQIEATLERGAAEDAAFDAAVARIEADGFRIANGRSELSEHGECTGWEYKDWRSGEVLAAGTFATGEINWPDNWFHVDRVRDEASLGPLPHVPGPPEWLADAIAFEAVEHEHGEAVMTGVKKVKVTVTIDEDTKKWLALQARRYGGSQNTEIVRSVVERREREAAQERQLTSAGAA